MKKTLIWSVLAAFTLSLPVDAAWAGAGGRFEIPEDVAFNPDVTKAVPGAEVFRNLGIGGSASGYRMEMIGSKFASVYDPEGSPVAIFDLSLNHLTLGDILLGGIGFGDLNLGRLIKLILKWKKKKKDGNDADADDSQPLPADFLALGKNVAPEKRADAFKAAEKAFGDLRFTSAWARANGVEDTDKEPGVPFRMGNFTTADLQYPDTEMRDLAYQPFVMLAQTLYPGEEWSLANIEPFIREFEFRYVDARPGFDLYWKRSDRQEKKEHLPGVVVNYLNPYQNLVYKYNVYKIQRWGELLIQVFGVWGMVADLLVSRVCQNLIERLDYHENQLISLLEAQERFEYRSGLGFGLADATIDALYLNKLTGTNDPALMIGPLKRKRAREAQEKGHDKSLARLLKVAGKKGVAVEEFGGGKFAGAWNGGSREDGEFKGIYGLGLKPMFLTQLLTLHVNAKTPAFKVVERYVTDLLGFLSRVLIPNNFSFKIWKIYFGIRIDPDTKDNFIRARMMNETNLEGELVGLIDEGLAGRASLPLSQGEMEVTRQRLRQTFINPYKLDLEEEGPAIERNLELLKRRLAEGNRGEAVFVPEKMVSQVF